MSRWLRSTADVLRGAPGRNRICCRIVLSRVTKLPRTKIGPTCMRGPSVTFHVKLTVSPCRSTSGSTDASPNPVSPNRRTSRLPSAWTMGGA